MSEKKEFEKRIKDICKVLANLEENEERYLRITQQLDENYICAVGNYRKNSRGSYSIRLKIGINTLLKIRNSTEFEQVKRVVEFLDKHPEYVEALDRLNGQKSAAKSQKDEDMFI